VLQLTNCYSAYVLCVLTTVRRVIFVGLLHLIRLSISLLQFRAAPEK